MTREIDALIASADDHKFTLRLPEEIHEQLEASRQRESRSLNSEILLRLQRTVDQDNQMEEIGMRVHLGIIEFLAECVQELADMLPSEQQADTKVQLMLELTRKFISQKGAD